MFTLWLYSIFYFSLKNESIGKNLGDSVKNFFTKCREQAGKQARSIIPLWGLGPEHATIFNSSTIWLTRRPVSKISYSLCRLPHIGSFIQGVCEANPRPVSVWFLKYIRYFFFTNFMQQYVFRLYSTKLNLTDFNCLCASSF